MDVNKPGMSPQLGRVKFRKFLQGGKDGDFVKVDVCVADVEGEGWSSTFEGSERMNAKTEDGFGCILLSGAEMQE